MVISLRVMFKKLDCSIGWINLQPDGSISVGFKDRTFISPKFRERQMLFNFYNRITTEYLIANSPETLIPVINPHFTFHPPIYFHLRENKKEEIFAGIAEPQLMLLNDEVVPWIRFVSKPVRELISNKERTESTIIERINVQNDDCSIGFGIDFVRHEQQPIPGLLLSRCIDWKNHRIHLFCHEIFPAQAPTMAWYHQS